MEKSFQTGTLDLTLGEIAEMLDGTVEGPSNFRVRRLASAETSDPEGLAFAEKQKYVLQAKASGVGALLIGPDMESDGVPSVRVSNPRMAFFMLLVRTDRPFSLPVGIHPTAVVDPTANVSALARVGPYSVIGSHAVIEDGGTIHPFAYVGEYCSVRKDAVVLPHAVLLRNVNLGERSVVFSGAVVGGDGFGFVWDGSRQMKIPQVGGVTIGPDCEIGSLTAIDRATAGSTSVGAGTKIDNLVQIAHNVRIGENVVMAALSGIAGTTSIGDRAIIGGMSTVSDHINICADTMLGGRAGVVADIVEPGAYFDFPAQPVLKARRNMIHRQNLSEIVARLRLVEEKLARLEAEKP